VISTLLLWSATEPAPWVENLGLWVAIPVQLAATAVTTWLLFSRVLRSALERIAWQWVLIFTALSPVATYIWNTGSSTASMESLSFGDTVYLLDYWILAVGFAWLFVRAGGSFRRPRVWIEGGTMTAVQLVGLWTWVIAPALDHGSSSRITFSATLAYSISLATLLSMAGLVLLQLPRSRARTAYSWLIAAVVAEVAWEILWMTSWLVDWDFVGPYFNFGDAICFSCIITAVFAIQRIGADDWVESKIDPGSESFFPVLAGLTGIALVAGSIGSTRRLDAWILGGLVALCASLLIRRQRAVHDEMRDLLRRLATGEADARLTELVRRSTDLIVVASVRGIVQFASPAAETMLGLSSTQTIGRDVTELFGPEFSAPLHEFLGRIRTSPEVSKYVEIRAPRDPGGLRVIGITANNQLSNPLINGIVLTLTDVTERSLLEREVLDAAMHERTMLCGDIHDGIGQDLVGISMLLQGAARAPDPDPDAHRDQLQSIVGHVNQTLNAARNLARGLSPLRVVQGSLTSALRRFVQESKAGVEISLDIDPAFDERVIDDLSAEHLYRITQEAVGNALRHSGCRNIHVTVRVIDAALVIEIVDDGQGIDTLDRDYAGLGLRLMEYRARIIGGLLHIDRGGGSGARITVTMLLSNFGAIRTLYDAAKTPRRAQ